MLVDRAKLDPVREGHAISLSRDIVQPYVSQSEYIPELKKTSSTCNTKVPALPINQSHLFKSPSSRSVQKQLIVRPELRYYIVALWIKLNAVDAPTRRRRSTRTRW